MNCIMLEKNKKRMVVPGADAGTEANQLELLRADAYATVKEIGVNSSR